MSIQLTSEENEVLVSVITSDKKHGTLWAIGTQKQWLEIRTSKSGKIIPFMVHKGKHPYFTLEKKAIDAITS